MLTACVRDLHKTFPGEYLTDVRTPCPELWENNPYLSWLSESSGNVQTIDCECPLIQTSNRLPYHYIHGFQHFVGEKLGVSIQPTAFKGDLHLSEGERHRRSPIAERLGEEGPFWLISAGGKRDFTVKWWDVRRYQQVVDYFRGRIQFVQVGGVGHFHPELTGVIDLRGKTTLRELIRLVYYSQGIVSPVSLLMHLSAAVEMRGFPASGDEAVLRPCIVIAGGREPVHWEQYPGHQFLHSVGAIDCCRHGGCWRSRTRPLGDGSNFDRPEQVCRNVVGTLPKCMEIITAKDVIAAIERYSGAPGSTRGDHAVSTRQPAATIPHSEGRQLPFQAELNQQVAAIPRYPARLKKRGILVCCNRDSLPSALLSIKDLRDRGCRLPIELWYKGAGRTDPRIPAVCELHKATCHEFPDSLVLSDWGLKIYALVHSPFRRALVLDPNVAFFTEPARLLRRQALERTAAVFWQTDSQTGSAELRRSGLPLRNYRSIDLRQFVADKELGWKAFNIALWLHSQMSVTYPFITEESEILQFAMEITRSAFRVLSPPNKQADGVVVQRAECGQPLFHGWKSRIGGLESRVVRNAYDRAPTGLEELFRMEHSADEEVPCIIQLGRLGDVTNILPVAYALSLRHRRRIPFVVQREFASLLDGASYTTPVIFDGDPFDLSGAREFARVKGYRNLLCTQVCAYGLSLQPQCRSFAIESWRMAGFENDFGKIPLVFDNRDEATETRFRRRILKGRASGKPLLLVNTASHSSPFPNTERLSVFLQNHWADHFEIVDISRLRPQKPHMLLTLFEQSAILVTVDTFTLHLANATPIAVFAFLQDSPSNWYGSPVGINSFGSTPYSDSGNFGALNRAIARCAGEPPRIFHVYSHYEPQTPDTKRRYSLAQLSWHAASGLQSIGVSNEKVRTFNDGVRQLPFIKDLIDHAIAELQPGSQDVLMLTNADTVLAADVERRLRLRIQQCGDATFSFRRDFPRLSELLPPHKIRLGDYYPGCDLFAFRVRWWKKHRDEFPDLVLGAEAWDWCMRTLVLKYSDGDCGFDDLIYHEKHPSLWESPDSINTLPSQRHNRALAKPFLLANGAYNGCWEPTNNSSNEHRLLHIFKRI